MLDLRPNCEACDRDLGPDRPGAMLCTFECTFCDSCGIDRFERTCPNCGGELVARPQRPTLLPAKYPASTERVHGDHGDTQAHTRRTADDKAVRLGGAFWPEKHRDYSGEHDDRGCPAQRNA